MIKKLFVGLLIVTFFNVLHSDTEAKAMMSPQEMLGIVVELLEEFNAQEETLDDEEERIFEDKNYDDSLGQYAHPAEMGKRVDYHYFVEHEGTLIPLEMRIQANILTGDNAYQFLGMNEAYQVFDQMNSQEEWIVIEFELEIFDDSEHSDLTHEIKPEDFDLYIANSPDNKVYEPIYNEHLFESVVLQPGNIFEGKIAKRVPKYTDFTIRFGTGEKPSHVFWYYYAEEDPNIIY